MQQCGHEAKAATYFGLIARLVWMRGAVKNSLCAAENRPAYYTLSEARLSSTALDAACKELQIEPVLTDGRLSESQAPLPLRARACTRMLRTSLDPTLRAGAGPHVHRL